MILVSDNAHIVFIPFPSPNDRHFIFRGNAVSTQADGKLILHTKSTEHSITTGGKHPILVVVPARTRTDNPALGAIITKTRGPGKNNPFLASANDASGNSFVMRLTQEPIELVMGGGLDKPSEGGALYHCYSLGNTLSPDVESRYDLVFKYQHSFRPTGQAEPASEPEFFSTSLAFGKFQRADFSAEFKKYYPDCKPIDEPPMISIDLDPEVIVTPGGDD